MDGQCNMKVSLFKNLSVLKLNQVNSFLCLLFSKTDITLSGQFLIVMDSLVLVCSIDCTISLITVLRLVSPLYFGHLHIFK